MKIWQKYFSVMKASLIYLEMMEKNNVKRRIGERLSAKGTKKTVQFGGGSVMVFGMFSSQGTTHLVRLQTRVNAQIYKNTVQDHVLPIIQNSGFDRATFMQDNVPCHKAKVVMSYLSEQEWSKISIEDCQELIRSCSRRCAAVIESKGSFTKYRLYLYFYCFFGCLHCFSQFCSILLDVPNLKINK